MKKKPVRFRLDPKKLEATLTKRFLTQEEGAEKCGVAKATMSYWLTGKRGAKLASIKKLAKGLGVGVEELVK